MASQMTLPTEGMSALTVKETESSATTLPNNSSEEKSVSYWTSLIRQNLTIAQTIAAADSDDESTNSIHVNEEIMNAPRRKTTREALARDIAAHLYPAPPDSLAPIIRYEKDIVMLRHLVLEQRRSAITKAAERNARTNWIKRIGKQGPWDELADPLSLTGAPSLPMPVEQSDPESLVPFFAHLASDGTHEPSSSTPVKEGHGGYTVGTEPYYSTDLIEFEKGVLYADGRVDLCKMVTGPRNIGALMESLKTNTFSKHFLLGNNIVGPTGAQAIAELVQEYPERFETWYLAGNCIDGPSFGKLVDAMVKSPVITNVWMKRNPLRPAAAKDVFRLVTQTLKLRTLDLDQTELGDEGAAELFGLLAEHKAVTPLPLKNIYINACGVGAKGCEQIARFLISSHCHLEGLYASNNPMGDGVSFLAAGVKRNKSLKRVVLQSCGLKDAGIEALAQAVKGHLTLTVLDVGQGYATEDLGMRYNWLTDASAPTLVDLINATNLQYLNLSYTALSQSGLNTIFAAVSASSSLLWFHAKVPTTGARDATAVKAGQEGARLYKLARVRLHENVERLYGIGYAEFEGEYKRFLVSPRDVRFIDSVYRNRDAGAARRGLKRLEKWWPQEDETLVRVKEGTLG